MIHIFHFLQSDMGFYGFHLQREKLPDFNAFPVNLHWHKGSNVFPARWILLLVFSVTPYQDKNKSRSIDRVQNLEKERR